MRKVIVSEFLTLDGVMQAPGGQDEDRSGGFDQGGWQRRYFDPVFGKTVLEALTTSGGLLLGRKTYELFAAYWPKQSGGEPVAPVMNGLPKFVASTTLRGPLAWQNSTLLEGDVAAAVGRLKQQDGRDLLVVGSGRLAQSLMRGGLIDEYRLMIHPLIVGKGKRLFEDMTPVALRLADSQATATGVLILRYQVA